MSYFETGSTQLIARSGYAGVDGFTDALKKLGSALKSGAGSALNFYGQQQQQAGQLQAYQQQAAARGAGGGLPGWVMPVAVVGGLGLLALVLLKRKKRRNPSRKRRRNATQHGPVASWQVAHWRSKHPKLDRQGVRDLNTHSATTRGGVNKQRWAKAYATGYLSR